MTETSARAGLFSLGFASWFTVDIRALAAMRMGLGLCALYDLLARIPAFELFYGGTDSGMAPVGDATLGLGLLSGTHPQWMAWLVLGLGLTAAVLFTVGRWTRPSQVVLLAALFSFQAAHFEVTISGGSTVLRQVLLIALFLPLARCWSLDALRGARAPTARWSVSWAYLVLIVQTSIIYINTAFNKDGPSWSEGSALLDVLTLETRVTDLGRMVRASLDMDLCVSLTHGVHIFELAAPIFLLLPLGSGRIRR